MYSIDDLAHDFHKLGVDPGDTVFLHASVRAVGEVAGGLDAIHLALKSALTPEGTLVEPHHHQQPRRSSRRSRDLHLKRPRPA